MSKTPSHIKHNVIIMEIVKNYIERLYIEEKVGVEPDETDYDIMEYQGVLVGPIEIWGRYVGIDDILLCEKHNFLAISVLDYADLCLELSYKNEKPTYNYFNYTKFQLDPKQFKKEEAEDLKRSAKIAKEVEKEFLDLLNN